MWCVCENEKGRVVKLYLYSIVMDSICGQGFCNAHITVRSRNTDMQWLQRNKAVHRADQHYQRRIHLLYNSLPSGLPTDLLVMLYCPIFTVGARANQGKKKCSNGGKRGRGGESLTSRPGMDAPLRPGLEEQGAFSGQTLLHHY